MKMPEMIIADCRICGAPPTEGNGIANFPLEDGSIMVWCGACNNSLAPFLKYDEVNKYFYVNRHLPVTYGLTRHEC